MAYSFANKRLEILNFMMLELLCLRRSRKYYLEGTSLILIILFLLEGLDE
ncbi:MAG: hypothetical protein LBF33_01550 [Oscillospiraceae bacterium]|jgi:hypothetical protein|nr:hypothetical protein [Oscillospiraceae bacterium]